MHELIRRLALQGQKTSNSCNKYSFTACTVPVALKKDDVSDDVISFGFSTQMTLVYLRLIENDVMVMFTQYVRFEPPEYRSSLIIRG